MIDKPIASITKEDIEALVQSGRIEDRSIEYKRDLPRAIDEDRREFLRDVSAFANALGGDILYGIEENAGVPVAAHGVAITNFDALRLQLQNSLRSNLDPRLPAFDIEQVPGFPNGSVMVVRVYQSWRSPHMVTFRGLAKFYVRAAGQLHEMDVTELRAAFVGSEAIAERIRSFRDGRIAELLAGRSAIRDLAAPTTMLHILPIAGAFARADVDPRNVADQWRMLNVPRTTILEFVHSPSARPNLDGLLITSPRYELLCGRSPSFIQVFRNGGIEFAECHVNEVAGDLVPSKTLRRDDVEDHVFDPVVNGATFRAALGHTGPVVISLAMLRARDIDIVSASGMPYRTPRRFDRDVVVLPEVLIEDITPDITGCLRPLLDGLWQAAGFTGSDSYNEEGRYIRKPTR
jgi:hypothetical protein